jgi:hypothetical protein
MYLTILTGCDSEALQEADREALLSKIPDFLHNWENLK